jgi:hypothetical protein
MEESLLKNNKTCPKHKIVVGGMGIAALVMLVVFVLSIVTLHSMNKHFEHVEDDIKSLKHHMHEAEPHMPTKFMLPHTSYTPVVSQGNRGTCWLFAQVVF